MSSTSSPVFRATPVVRPRPSPLLKSADSSNANSLTASPRISRKGSKAGCHSPYGSGSDSDEVLLEGEQQMMEFQHLPPAYDASVNQAPNSQPAPIPGTIHSVLTGKCDFIEIPFIEPIVHPVPPSSFTLFLGQIRFETTAAELRWVLRKVTGVLPTMIEPRGAGCFIVHMSSWEDIQRVRQIHKKLLFDLTGVWYARTSQQLQSLNHYAATVLPTLARSAHLPRDCVVVEERKGRSYQHSSYHSPMNTYQQASPQYHSQGSPTYANMQPAQYYASGNQDFSTGASTCSSAYQSPHYKYQSDANGISQFELDDPRGFGTGEMSAAMEEPPKIDPAAVPAYFTYGNRTSAAPEGCGPIMPHLLS